MSRDEVVKRVSELIWETVDDWTPPAVVDRRVAAHMAVIDAYALAIRAGRTGDED